MNANKYGILSLIIGAVLFFGTFLLWYNQPGTVITGGWFGVLLTMFYGGLFLFGAFLFLVGILMLLL
ncbi:MAG: hypothetical protein QXR53_00210 [Candidatus Norongarragalinales archaeon]